MSSTFVHQSQSDAGFEAPLSERDAHRFQGMIIAAGASLALWGVAGAAVWGIVSLVS